MHLSLKNLQWLICHKTQPTKPNLCLILIIYLQTSDVVSSIVHTNSFISTHLNAFECFYLAIIILFNTFYSFARSQLVYSSGLADWAKAFKCVLLNITLIQHKAKYKRISWDKGYEFNSCLSFS